MCHHELTWFNGKERKEEKKRTLEPQMPPEKISKQWPNDTPVSPTMVKETDEARTYEEEKILAGTGG